MFQKAVFKVCPNCRHRWLTRDDLLYDTDVSLLGYQMHFKDFKLGIFYFNHMKQDCETTLTIGVSEFLDLYNGPMYTENKLADGDCPMYCLRRNNLEQCHQPCQGAFVREIIQIIQSIHQEATHPVYPAV